MLDDATYGVLQRLAREPALMLTRRRIEDVDACVRAGFTFYTIDPGDHVDNDAETASPPTWRPA